ncbi:hypothetical protein M422DRAFT_775802 [Sphaerobolus stellatus SS14]|nr:hypothetical protein M422DRAFT_775802 [Sphaerobolus stellatus SS14]
MLPPIHAVLVGIDNYPHPFSPLTSAVRDACKVKDFLREKLAVPEGNITLLKDAQATKERIIGSISSLTQKANRDDAIIFVFSGYTGKPTSMGVVGGGKANDVGMICPVDVSDQGGISDTSLVQLFDQVSKSCGNNIIIFLDCAAKIFHWNNPTSCVIMAPAEANETAEGGVFTHALIKLLSEQRENIDSFTVQAFADHVQTTIDAKIYCIGSNVDRPLFNMKADKGHYALIAGRTLTDGSIMLYAGTAHGVRRNSVYGIYPSNIKDHLTRLGELYVYALNNDDITAILRCKGGEEFKVPPFFYAVEESGYSDKLKVWVHNSPNVLQGLSDFELNEESEANITVKVVDNKTLLAWNGLADDPREKHISFDTALTDSSQIQKEIRRAARFCSHLGALSPDNSSISSKIQVQFHEIDPKTDQSTGKNLLKHEDFTLLKNSHVDLKLKAEEGPKPYCLTILNNNTFPVWPYVFIYDPEGFIITPWFLPSPGDLDSPLPENSKLTIGCDNTEGRFIVEHRENRHHDFIYFKIFITKERTNFAFHTQWYSSPLEDKLRGYTQREAMSRSSETIPSVGSFEEEAERQSKRDLSAIKISRWASMRISILQMYTGSDSSSPNKLGLPDVERLNLRGLLRPWQRR